VHRPVNGNVLPRVRDMDTIEGELRLLARAR
jgi:hypothetical protein